MTQENIQKINKELESSQKSLKERMTDLKSKIEKFQKHKNSVILCDVSGSMDVEVDSNGSDMLEAKRAIDVVNEVLLNFKGCNLWEFSSVGNCKKVTKLAEPNGGTALAEAFETMKGQNFKEFVLITDGEPNDQKRALNSAQDLKINIIYIGPSPTPKFLRDLAQITNGNFVDVELMKLGSVEGTKELENKIRLMLNA